MSSIDIRILSFARIAMFSIFLAAIGIAQDTDTAESRAIQLHERLATACKERNLPAIWRGNIGSIVPPWSVWQGFGSGSLLMKINQMWNKLN